MKIICVGRNYADHAKELGNDLPTKPLLFMKPSTALLIDGKPFYHPDFSQDIHYECELVLKIKKNGKHINEQFASDYYDEIGLGIDFTARDLQEECKAARSPWEVAKAFDNSAVIGRFISISEVNLNNIQFDLYKNDERVQHGESKDLIFGFDVLISYISKFFTLQQGDYIFTGTPAGVGRVQIGDRLSGGIGDQQLLSCEVK